MLLWEKKDNIFNIKSLLGNLSYGILIAPIGRPRQHWDNTNGNMVGIHINGPQRDGFTSQYT